MAYATFDRMVAVYGAQRLHASTPAQADQSSQEYWEAKLEAAAGEMDLYFARAGFTVPLDVSAIPVPQQPSALSWLAEVNVTIAIDLGSPAITQTAKGVKSASSRYVETLGRIASGKLRLPWLAQPEPVFAVVTAAETDPYGVGLPTLDGTTFSNFRDLDDG